MSLEACTEIPGRYYAVIPSVLYLCWRLNQWASRIWYPPVCGVLVEPEAGGDMKFGSIQI